VYQLIEKGNCELIRYSKIKLKKAKKASMPPSVGIGSLKAYRVVFRAMSELYIF
jgi:hypothetical protein